MVSAHVFFVEGHVVGKERERERGGSERECPGFCLGGG